MFNFLKNIGPVEFFVIAAILIILFGGRAITRLGRASGETFKEIKKVKKSFTEALDDDEPGKKEASN